MKPNETFVTICLTRLVFGLSNCDFVSICRISLIPKLEMNEIETETVKGNDHRRGLLLTSVRSLVQSHYLLTAIDECQSVFSQQH